MARTYADHFLHRSGIQTRKMLHLLIQVDWLHIISLDVQFTFIRHFVLSGGTALAG